MHRICDEVLCTLGTNVCVQMSSTTKVCHMHVHNAGIYETCTQEDFLWVASVIRSTSDINISDLVACLGVSFDGRDETGDQIAQSFILWQSKNEALKVDYSREKLLQCLQQLQGASTFIDKIRERYS